MQAIQIPNSVEALIFDMDGTLANTIQAHVDAWKKVLAPYPTITFNKELFDQINGIPTVETVDWLNHKFHLTMDPKAIAAEKLRIFDTIAQDIQAVEATAEVVRKYYDKMPMSIGSGATTAVIRETIQKIGLATYFDILVGSDMVKKHKPNPETWLLCAKLMNVDPRKCLVFEDGILGMQGAEAAGMQYVDIRPYITDLKF